MAHGETRPPSLEQAMKTEGHCAETNFSISEQATILFVRTAALLLVWDGDPRGPTSLGDIFLFFYAQEFSVFFFFCDHDCSMRLVNNYLPVVIRRSYRNS